jgi:hypothetical protein
MAERARYRALGRIVALRAVQRDAAQQSLFAATEREREAEAADKRADDRAQAAVADWQTHLSDGAFHPELAVALAGQLVQAADAHSAALSHTAAMRDARAGCESDWQEAQARSRQADRSLAGSRRTLLRERDERVLESVADRVTFAWRRA